MLWTLRLKSSQFDSSCVLSSWNKKTFLVFLYLAESGNSGGDFVVVVLFCVFVFVETGSCSVARADFELVRSFCHSLPNAGTATPGLFRTARSRTRGPASLGVVGGGIVGWWGGCLAGKGSLAKQNPGHVRRGHWEWEAESGGRRWRSRWGKLTICQDILQGLPFPPVGSEGRNSKVDHSSMTSSEAISVSANPLGNVGLRVEDRSW